MIKIKNLIGDRFNHLDRKLDETKAELKQNITEAKSELNPNISDVKGDIKALHAEIQGVEKRLSNVENSAAKIPEITEKFGELKNCGVTLRHR